ncbi:MAG: tetratricopeptide repeat protein [Alphaproteobacteria bacterium]|nr:tetratricopeptide repeat protein [Alphaproteobacteria bacterium]
MSESADVFFDDAQKKYQSGDLTDAADLYQKALERDPSHPDALHMLGLTAYQLGQTDAAAALLEQATKVRQPFAEAEANLGTVLMALGRLDDALDALLLAQTHAPDNAAILFNLGNAHNELHDWPAAKTAYEQAVSLMPDHAQAWCQLGMVHRALDELPQAMKAYGHAIEAQPDHSQALYNLANVHRDLGSLGEAEKLLRQALGIRKDYAKAWNSLGTLLGDMGRSKEALDAFDQAVLFAPESAAYASNRLCGLQYVEGVTGAQLSEAHLEWYWLHIATSVDPTPPVQTAPDPNKTLRVGFVSPDFGNHPVGYLSLGLFESLNSTDTETIVFSTRVNTLKDELSRRIEFACGTWLDVAALNDEELAENIRQHEIDILFDMSGQTANHRLAVFARKPAPLQMSWIGYVGTTGLPTMDFIVGDRHQFPDDASETYCEKPLMMPDGYVCYTPPPDAPSVTALPAVEARHITYGCLNNPAKLNASVLDAFAKVLLKTPDSHLLFRFRGMDDPAVHTPIVSALKTRGISPDRLFFEGRASHKEFLDTYNRIDIALDTFPYSGGLTTCEALWMGVPTVTFPGTTFAGRHAASHMRTAGYGDLVADDANDMVEKTVALAEDIETLATLRNEMRNQVSTSALCDAKKFAAGFTGVMRSTWQDYCKTA